ncbi:eukaryotic translation initiation factor 5B-like [Rana temporaria]|uniref:eukaryotic translation initiation factor 5B-like n=1 Tax=Rana temporaria TaxID=8407 RepID=UPI001AAC9030|nr:eukaryotic translation initiation factor 5B-like [Rana temporaria]
MVRQIRKREECFAPIAQRQLGESKEEEEEEVSRVENVCCSTSNNSDMSARKRRREEVSDSTREEGENSVEENGATPRKQRKYDSAAETGHSAAQQRGKKRKYTEETECESPVVKKRTVQSSSEVDDDTTRKQSRSYTARETGHSAAQRGKKRKCPAETECESPVVKKRTVQSSSEVDDDTTRKQSRSYTARETGHSAAQRGKKRKCPAETECESPVVKKRTVQSSSEEDGETLSRYYTARETVQDATEQKGKKRKSTEEPECESPVTKKGRTDKAGVSGTTSTHSTKSKECETASLGPEDFIFHRILGEGDIKKVSDQR